jgi:hypothetical protein
VSEKKHPVHEVFHSEKLREFTQSRFDMFLDDANKNGTLRLEKIKALSTTRVKMFSDFKTDSESEFVMVLKREPLDQSFDAKAFRVFFNLFFFGLPYFQNRYRNRVRPLTVRLEVNDRLETLVTFLDWE